MVKKFVFLLSFFSFVLPIQCDASVLPQLTPHFFSWNNKNSEINCDDYERHGLEILLEPNCVFNKKIPVLSLNDRIDAIWNNIWEIWEWYNPDKWFAVYKPINIILSWTKKLFPLSKTIKDKYNEAIKNWNKIEIPISYFAQDSLDNLVFYVSKKDISKLWKCTKINYLLAFENLDWKILKPWEEFNFNNYLFNLKGYCSWLWTQDLWFYWWVCWAASQLFRASLSSPLVEIPVRWNHNERFSVYYWEKVQWDDASVYERSKKLIIKNISNYDIIIKTLVNGDATYLFLISDKESSDGKWVEIEKHYISPLRVDLTKSIYKKNIIEERHSFIIPNWFNLGKGKEEIQLISSQDFSSRYIGINNENR
jgi:hypothetical protein